jgi:hypothetical protein
MLTRGVPERNADAMMTAGAIVRKAGMDVSLLGRKPEHSE